MNTQDKYQALVKIQSQLQEWAARQPEDHYKKYGNKEIIEALQLSKKLVDLAKLDIANEEAQCLALYDVQYNDSCDTLGIQNIQ